MSKITEAAIVLALVGVITLVGNWIGYGFGLAEALPGMATLFVICVLGILANRFIYKLPTVLYVITIGMIVTLPGFPGSATVAAWVSKVNFLALTTPILAYAGVGIGKDLPALKETGWRIVVVSLFVMAGTYVGSAAIAHVVLKYLGEI
ncbi:hypothetical protein Dde_3032 [Oleidesulfovibrio alaskensis G20]|jgi:NhaP-type Na+/H+ or K+/H+ antiporter|uniref:DUF340 domain-containing protein n=1 Tax=Oleidesulfovibrio alaskensis (strain ATCC BAA-1058 / DSM 17464 / G20) TaxID=207559 RepID=Q30WX0_OLEA2|nr:hypothetical protein [Oleidesulfovibrio alaskensis]ABB39826.1 hypothetical protein Dde_3032 [Oleidesulfovibrio alaskensis G20]MBG0773439.1 hypothetical protein [Oleidesulfovibrio alaskensis]MBL3581961.1 hypothetical protein [Oleidesulfovibrio alaskensis]